MTLRCHSASRWGRTADSAHAIQVEGFVYPHLFERVPNRLAGCPPTPAGESFPAVAREDAEPQIEFVPALKPHIDVVFVPPHA